MIGAPVYQRASRMASSAASAPVVPNTTRRGRTPRGQRGQPGGQPFPLVAGQVEIVHELAGLLGHRGGDGRVAVPGVGHREPGQHVHVLRAVGVPDQRAAAAHDGGRAVEQCEADLAGQLVPDLLTQDFLAGRPVAGALHARQQLLWASVHPFALADEPIAERPLIQLTLP